LGLLSLQWPGLDRGRDLFVVITAATLVTGRQRRRFGPAYSVQSGMGVFFEPATLGASVVMVLAGVACWAIGAGPH
jgi:hypothetical protein